MEKIKEITKEKALQIYDDLKCYYIDKRYNFEQIFIDSGDYDDVDRNTLYKFISPLMDIIDSNGSKGFEDYLKTNSAQSVKENE
jgi:hypothetical protein